MKKLYALTFIIISVQIMANTDTLDFTVSSTTHAKMPLTIMVLDEDNATLQEIARTIASDLQFTEQCNVSIKKYPANLPKKQLLTEIKTLFSCGTPLALCINQGSKKHIEWRLYDTIEGNMIEGKKYKKQGSVVRGWAHKIADETWTLLTGNNGFFSSRIAYCKEAKTKKGNTIRNLCIADFDGSNEELLDNAQTIAVAPRFHGTKPRIFYTKYADANAPLWSVSVSKKKKKRIASNFDGTNMQPGFSPDGRSVVYCLSHGAGNCKVYFYNKGKLECFSENNGNNVSPVFIDNKQICFCSDFQTGKPQIYIGNIKTGDIQRITRGGYCSSPSYCPKNNKLAYHMMVNEKMQIFLYDFETKKSCQITKAQTNKHEVSWSPCGTRLIFSQEYAGKSRIVSLNLLTNTCKYLTSKNEYCSYPNCSPSYGIFPVTT